MPHQVTPSTVTWAGYPGSKAAGGVAERIAGLFPPHRAYVEAFLGHGAVMRRKSRAAVNIGIDLDAAIVARWRAAARDENGGAAGVEVVCGDALRILPSLPAARDPNAVVYIDAPYILNARSSRKRLYRCELDTPEAHAALIDVARGLPCRVAISHYPHPLYDSRLADWRRVDIPAMTRGGKRVECVWCNFPEPGEFHDPLLANVGHRERSRVKRRAGRWLARLDRLPPAERAFIFDALRARLAISGGEILNAKSDAAAEVAASRIVDAVVAPPVWSGVFDTSDVRNLPPAVLERFFPSPVHKTPHQSNAEALSGVGPTSESSPGAGPSALQPLANSAEAA